MPETPDAGLPLGDVVLLDLTGARAGPTAVCQLADWGADVVRVESLTVATAENTRSAPGSVRSVVA